MINNLEVKYKFQTNNLYFYFCIFFFTFAIFRIILPLGDEPDYPHRFQMYIFNFDNFIAHTNDYSQAVTCNKYYLKGNLFDVFMSIAPYFCNNSIEDFIERVSIGFVINILYFTLIFIFFKSKKILKFLYLEKEFNDLNMHIFFCSLLYPTIIYYLGTRSNEIFLFYIILLFFLTWRNFILSYILAFITLFIDIGNGLVFFLFINYFYIFRLLNLFISIKTIIFAHLLIFFILIYFHDYLILYLAELFNQSGITFFQNIGKWVLKNDKLYIYPNYVKLIITYLSFIFLSPGFVKSTILFVVMTLIIFYTFLVVVGFIKNKNFDNFFKEKKFFNDYLINSLASINFVILMVLVFPSHSYIRYFLFIYPFIFSIFFLIFNSKNIFLISFYAILFLSIETILFRIIYYL